MSDVQRWDLFAEVGINEPVKYDMWEAVEGRYVLYADHVAAVAAAQREGSNQGYLNGVATNVDNSFKAGVKAARDAVKAAYPCRCLQPQPLDGHWGYCPRMEVVPALAAIDALRGESNG